MTGHRSGTSEWPRQGYNESQALSNMVLCTHLPPLPRTQRLRGVALALLGEMPGPSTAALPAPHRLCLQLQGVLLLLLHI